MFSASITLPVLDHGRPLRLTPTDVSQFVRLEQCERYLRFRLAERAGQDFMDAYGVVPQRITPLLSLSGRRFEEHIEEALERRFRTVHYAAKYALAHNRPDNNREVADEARRLPPGEAVLLFQPRLETELDGWRLRGDVDLLRLERVADGALHVLIADMKSTAEVKVEHRLQVTFYHLMLDRLFRDERISCDRIQTGIIFRGPTEPEPDDAERVKTLRQAAQDFLGRDDALLEIVADPDAYLRSVHDLVTGPDLLARRIARSALEDLSFALDFKCDGCLYNEFCMKWSAEHEDLALLPYLTGIEKEALRRSGVRTISDLASYSDRSAARSSWNW